MGLVSIGDSRLELFRLHAMRGVDACLSPVQTQRQQARADLEVGCVSSTREVWVASSSSGVGKGRPGPTEGNESSQDGQP